MRLQLPLQLLESRRGRVGAGELRAVLRSARRGGEGVQRLVQRLLRDVRAACMHHLQRGGAHGALQQLRALPRLLRERVVVHQRFQRPCTASSTSLAQSQ